MEHIIKSLYLILGEEGGGLNTALTPYFTGKSKTMTQPSNCAVPLASLCADDMQLW